MSSDIVTLKQTLNEELGENFKQYLTFMKLWFRMKLTKEEFDARIRKLLKPSIIKTHNEFLIAILNKCHMEMTSEVESSKLKSSGEIPAKTISSNVKRTQVYDNSDYNFQPASPHAYIEPYFSKELTDERAGFCSRTLMLPDNSMVHGRMLVTAWDLELSEVEEQAVLLLVKAIELFIKSILTSIITRRKSYQIREGNFIYNFGIPTPNHELKNTALLQDACMQSNATDVCDADRLHLPSLRLTYEQAEQRAAYALACSGMHYPTAKPINMFELYEALKVHKNVIPSHGVYSLNMERIISRLWQPDE